MLSCFSPVLLCAILWTVAYKAPLSMECSRQEYWSGLPCPPPGIFPTQGSNPSLLCLSHWQAASPGKPKVQPSLNSWHTGDGIKSAGKKGY